MKLGIEIAAFGLLLAWGLRRWWLWFRRRHLRVDIASPSWLNEHVYERTGDDRHST
jgi:hypothetical protein